MVDGVTQGDMNAALLSLILRNSREGMLLLDRKGVVREVNRAFLHQFRLDPAHIQGRHYRRLIPAEHQETPLEVIEGTLWHAGSWRGNLLMKDADGRALRVFTKINVLLPSPGGLRHYFLCHFANPVRDHILPAAVTADDVTGLPNRMLFEDRLRQAIHQARRRGGCLGVIFADIDRFTLINDTLGHAAGDDLLREVAQRLTLTLRTSDSVARMNADAFAVLLTDLGDGEESARNAGMIARKIREQVGGEVHLNGQRMQVSFSLGITLFPQDGESVDTMLRNAESAVSHARKAGGDRVEFFSQRMSDSAKARFEMENKLRIALERDELRLYYQPQVEISTGAVVGVEALVRWQHPERGLVPPGEFITVAEESGLIVALGEWVLRRACQQYAQWRDLGLGNIRMGVNISALQFQRQDLPRLVEELLLKNGIQPEFLELEITESAIMEDVERTIQTLNRISALGVKLSIDDFGTGYSSLSYLRRFPVKTLKIDRSFVNSLGENDSDAAIVHAIIAMAHSLKLNVIAEGLETGVQLSIMHQLRCNEMQGFLFSRPLPAEEMTELLRLGKRLQVEHGPPIPPA